MSREAMKQALEALDSDNPDIQLRAAIALRQALEIEPKALRLADALDAEFVQGRISNSTGRESAVELRRLALKQWVGLTDEEICRIKAQINGTLDVQFVVFTRAIEAKLKEKNT